MTFGRVCALFVLLVGCRPPTPAAGAVETVPVAARRAGLRVPFRRVFLRAFKREGELELWAGGDRMSLMRTYPIAAMSGGLGPKRREGDLQVPEGVYRIARFNPHSRYRLSMGLDYPNASDRVRGGPRPGTDIYIHGDRVSAGCIAMTDALIDEIYPLCAKAGNRGTIPVHVFPARLDDAALADLCRRVPAQAAFWSELKPIYDAFERTHIVPAVSVSPSGAYRLSTRSLTDHRLPSLRLGDFARTLSFSRKGAKTQREGCSAAS